MTELSKNKKVSSGGNSRGYLAPRVWGRALVSGFLLGLVLFFAIPPGYTQRLAPDFVAVGREVVTTVRTSFYDSTRARVWAQKYGGYADTVRSEASFVALTRSALADLATSHTAYYTPDDPEYYGLRAIFRRHFDIEDVAVESIGADIDADKFVRVVFAGSPAEAAGLRRGDLVIEANGEPFHRVKTFRDHAGTIVQLTVQRHPDGEPIKLRVQARKVDPEEEWLAAQRNGARIIERGDKKVAYIAVYSCAGPQYEDLVKELVAEELKEADALILDFRGGWGGCNTGFVDIFNRTPAVMDMVTRDGERLGWDTHWRMPLYLLIDGGTRSGKEVVAYSIKKHGLGILVGERTAGAVVAGSGFMLQDQSLLYLAVADVLVDGERLEGAGVEPDVYVEAGLRYANGADPQLETALDLAAPE